MPCLILLPTHFSFILSSPFSFIGLSVNIFHLRLQVLFREFTSIPLDEKFLQDTGRYATINSVEKSRVGPDALSVM